MPIEVVCPSCDKVHKVKDEAAGKKLRCKGCQTVIPIPAAAAAVEDDLWETLDENEGGEELPPVIRQASPTKKKSSKRSHSSSGDGMPVTVILSVGINGLFALYAAYSAVDFLMAGVIGKAIGSGVRVLFDIMIIKGLFDRSNRLRWNSIMLDGLGLGFLFLCFAPTALLARQQLEQQVAADAIGLLLLVFVIQSVLWLADLILLLTPSAKEHCNQ